MSQEILACRRACLKSFPGRVQVVGSLWDASVPGTVSKADLVVAHAGTLLTMVGPDEETRGPRRGEALGYLDTIPDGAVAIENGKILSTGPTRDILASFDAHRTLDARGGLVMPGFVDTHTHLVWAGSRAWELDSKVQGHTYQDITKAGGGIPYTMKQTRAATQTDLKAGVEHRAAVALAHGTTRLEAKSGYGMTHAAELQQLAALRAANETSAQTISATYLGLHERPPEFSDNIGAYVDEIRTKTLPELRDKKLADFVDAFVETGVYSPDEVRPALVEAQRLGFPIRLHVDEFTDLGGAAFAVEMGARSADHLLSVSSDGVAALGASDTVATLLPLVPFAVRQPKYAPFRALHEANSIIALASDFNPNVPCLSMTTVVQHAVYGMGMRPAQALVAATVNAGYSLAPDEGLGVLAPGHPADMVIMDVKEPVAIAYGFGRDPVRTTIVGGRVFEGRPAAPT